MHIRFGQNWSWIIRGYIGKYGFIYLNWLLSSVPLIHVLECPEVSKYIISWHAIIVVSESFSKDDKYLSKTFRGDVVNLLDSDRWIDCNNSLVTLQLRWANKQKPTQKFRQHLNMLKKLMLMPIHKGRTTIGSGLFHKWLCRGGRKALYLCTHHASIFIRSFII